MVRDRLMEYLYKAEGDEIHYNRNEKDITTPGGIYRYAHPDAEVFDYIDDVADEIGITSDSKHWGKRELNMMNIAVDPDVMAGYVERFYDEYLKGAKLELFHGNAKIAMYSFYVNSPKQAWKAVQQALLDMVELGMLKDITKDMLSRVDGRYGRKTEVALNSVHVSDKMFGMYICNAMKTRYTRLVAARPKKFLQYAKGWDNRVNEIVRLG